MKRWRFKINKTTLIVSRVTIRHQNGRKADKSYLPAKSILAHYSLYAKLIAQHFALADVANVKGAGLAHSEAVK